MIKPPALRKGATIGIVAPASPMRDASKLNIGIRYLESIGYRVECAPHMHHSTHYLAGSDDDRVSDLHQMFVNPAIDAIFCTRGGFGSMRLLTNLNYSLIKRHPKIFVGFSDLTALNSALLRKCGLVSFSGAMVGVDMVDFDPESEEQFWRVLRSRRPPGVVHQSLELKTLSHGTARGHLVCGNLSMLAALSGTPYQPRYTGAIVLLEDIGEESYRIDRMLCQLHLARATGSCAGLLFGQFTQDKSRTQNTPGRSLEAIFREYAELAGRSALANVMFGHTPKKLTLPFGVQCSMDASRRRFVLEEAGVS